MWVALISFQDIKKSFKHIQQTVENCRIKRSSGHMAVNYVVKLYSNIKSLKT